jgi:uncharacterized membrane protein
MILIPDSRAQDEKLKAIFVYNFTRYFAWPEKPGNFVIIIVGKSPLAAELNDIAQKKRVGNTQIEIRTVSTVQEITDAHIIYVTSSKTDQLASAAALSRSRNILVISEKESACKEGSGLNFIHKDSKLVFEICKSNLATCGLTVSSSLYTLGIVVNE